jgi:hypothetical protein
MDNYEEKYKEALQKAGDLLEYYRKPEYEHVLPYAKHDLESLFPELMTEDEKIRKTLIDLHKSTVAINGIKGERIVAWLERLGEQVATEEKIIIPKFRVGDMIRRKDSPDKLMEVRVIRDRHYLCNNIGRSSSTTIQIEDEDTCELVEKEPAWLSKEETGMLFTLINYLEEHGGGIGGYECVFLAKFLRSIKDRIHPQPKQEWSEEDEANLDYLIDFFNNIEKGTEKGRDLPCSSARKFSNWLYRVKSGEVSMKSCNKYSEEDEKVLHNACEFIHHRMNDHGGGGSINGMDYKVLYKKLKSIMLRSLWKPNGLQLHDLSYAIEHFRKEGLDNEGLVELFEQLKKL